MRRPTRHFDAARQTATLFRWFVWGAIFVILVAMIYQVVSRQDTGPSLASIPEPLPETERPTLPIDAEKLSVIKDNKVFRHAENETLFHVLDVLRRTPETEIRRASRGNVTWVQLFNQPEVYRGEPITLVGRIKGVKRKDAPKNDLGLKEYYQLWLVPGDEPDRLIAIYCLELPKNFPQKMEVDEPVILTGVFFKRWPYVSWKKREELAPLFLARSLEDWTPRPKVVRRPVSMMTFVIVIVVAVVFSIGMVLFCHFHTRRSKRGDLPEEITIPENFAEAHPWGEEEFCDEDHEEEGE